MSWCERGCRLSCQLGCRLSIFILKRNKVTWEVTSVLQNVEICKSPNNHGLYVEG
jgi:hypothetical protein